MNTRLFTLALGALALAGAVRAAIIVPGANGTDGALNITANTVIDLSQAVTGPWDNDNAANAGKGVYDPAKWAVVFKYTEVNIAAGATVTFKNHASRAPVVWLVSGNVTVDGTLSLDGQGSLPSPALAEPGPGGFRGGAGNLPNVVPAAGFGVGGGGFTIGGPGGQGLYVGGAYGSKGDSLGGLPPSDPYGNPSMIPLLGGSGGGGGWQRAGGAGGGGAILIASQGTLLINGEIRATGGSGQPLNWDSGTGSGSGGGIRLIAQTLSGAGNIKALGGAGGGVGRIRIERVGNGASIIPLPDPSVITLSANATALLWPPSGAPEVRVLSIGSANAPSDPRAEFGTIGADVALPLTASTQVLVETKNVEQASQVKVRGTPRSNGNFTEVVATVDSIVSNDPLVIRWKADLPVNVGYSAVQAHVIRP